MKHLIIFILIGFGFGQSGMIPLTDSIPIFHYGTPLDIEFLGSDGIWLGREHADSVWAKNFDPELLFVMDESNIDYLPSTTLTLVGDTGKELNLDFNGDTLRVYGNLELDSAAILFINHIKQYIKLIDCD